MGNGANGPVRRRLAVRIGMLVTLLVAAIASAGAPAVAEHAEPSSAGPWMVRTLQFNICGNAHDSEHCDPDSIAEAVYNSIEDRAIADRPHIITLNEVCDQQFSDLSDGPEDGSFPGLSSLGYSGEFFDIHDACGGYGNAIFVQGDISVEGKWELPSPSNSTEKRGLLCVRESRHDIVACATHLNYELNDTIAQAGAVAFQVERFVAAGDPVVLGGDFNARPGWELMNMFYEGCYPDGGGVFGEADADPYCTRTGEDTHVTQGKIVYLFYSSEHFRDFEGAVTDGRSDHRLLWGTGWLQP